MTDPPSPTNSGKSANPSSGEPSQIVGDPLAGTPQQTPNVIGPPFPGAAVGSTITNVDLKAHSGPLPSPDTLAHYKEIDPELPGYIMDRAKAEQQHRHSLETKVIDAQVRDATLMRVEVRRGQVLGAGVAMAFLAGSIYLGTNGHPVLAGTLGSTTVVSIVAVIVTGRKMHDGDVDDENDSE